MKKCLQDAIHKTGIAKVVKAAQAQWQGRTTINLEGMLRENLLAGCGHTRGAMFLLLAAGLTTIGQLNALAMGKAFGARLGGHQLGADHSMVEIRVVYLVRTDAAEKLNTVEIDGKGVVGVSMSMGESVRKLNRRRRSPATNVSTNKARIEAATNPLTNSTAQQFLAFHSADDASPQQSKSFGPAILGAVLLQVLAGRVGC